MVWINKELQNSSGVATGGSRGQSAPPWQQKICQKEGENQEKVGKNREKEEKSGRFSHFAPLTELATLQNRLQQDDCLTKTALICS